MSRGSKAFLAIATVLMFGLLIGLPVFSARAIRRDRTGECGATTFEGAPPSPADVATPAKLTLRADQEAVIAFGRSLRATTRDLQYDFTPGSVKLANFTVLAVDLTRFSLDSSFLDADLVSARAQYRNGLVLLQVCANRNGSEDLGDPGTYRGTISIVDPRVSRVDLPFTISMAYPAWPLVLDLAIGTCLAALGWVWLLRQPSDSSAPVVSAEFFHWISRREGLVALFAGLAAGIATVFTVYFNNPTWGSSLGNPIALVGAVFTAFVVAAGAPHVLAQASNSPAMAGSDAGVGSPVAK